MSYQYKHIEKLDQEQSREIRDIVSRVLTIDPGYPPKQLWLEKQEGWVAVPIAVDEDYTYFASGLLRIAEDIGYQELPGLFLDTEVSEPVGFFVPSNIEAILEFKQEPLSNYKVFFRWRTELGSRSNRIGLLYCRWYCSNGRKVPRSFSESGFYRV